MFTLTDALRHCEQATQNFQNKSLDEKSKTTLSTMKYTVVINKRLRTKAAVASMTTNKVTGVRVLKMELGLAILNRVTPEQQFEIVSHELAHLLDFALRGDSNHDGVWKRIHKSMGGTGERCHQFSVTDLRNKVTKILVVDNINKKEFMISPRAFRRYRQSLVHGNIENPGRYVVRKLTPEEVLLRKVVKSS
jgi:predicted SprT family Zn-dependent metalloprotease